MSNLENDIKKKNKSDILYPDTVNIYVCVSVSYTSVWGGSRISSQTLHFTDDNHK